MILNYEKFNFRIASDQLKILQNKNEVEVKEPNLLCTFIANVIKQCNFGIIGSTVLVCGDPK